MKNNCLEDRCFKHLSDYKKKKVMFQLLSEWLPMFKLLHYWSTEHQHQARTMAEV
jgi:hypothetical protein